MDIYSFAVKNGLTFLYSLFLNTQDVGEHKSRTDINYCAAKLKRVTHSQAEHFKAITTVLEGLCEIKVKY